MAYTPPPQYKSAYLRPKAQPNSRWIQLRLHGQCRTVVTTTTATTVTVSPSRWIPTNRLSVCCLSAAALLICRSWGAKASCCTRTAGKRCVHYLNLSGFDPSHREVGRQTVRGTISSPRHPPARAALISSAGQDPARVSAPHWSQAHSGSFQRLCGVVASRQSRAGHQTQPADRCQSVEKR